MTIRGTSVLRVLEAQGVVNKAKKDNMHMQRNEEAPLFHCCEMVLGELLGTGTFCEVHELHDVCLLSGIEHKLDGYSRQIEGNEQRRKREHIYRTCHDKTGNSRYVVKHLRPDLATDRSYKIFTHASVDCLKEFDILSRLSHPNIVQLRGGAVSERNNNNNDDNKDYGKIVEENNPENFFIILEKLGETLSQRILRWILTKKRVTKECDGSISDSVTATVLPPFYVEKLRYARDIASALAHLHDHGMVFRDLKPDNVGIASDGTAKLFDFGLCRELPRKDDHSSSSSSSSSYNNNVRREPVYRMSIVGTRRYMSPEMISGHGYNQKTDCYSWAMVFYEMLSLQKPYAKYNRALHKILVCEKQGRPCLSRMDVPWNSRNLLNRSWAQDFSDRPTLKQIYNELGPMIDTVEQQTLPLIERSLRAVLEMAELFAAFDDNKTPLPCIGGGIPCDDDDDSVRKFSSSLTTTTTDISIDNRSKRYCIGVA